MMEGKENKKIIKITSPEEKDMVGVQKVLYKTWLATYPNEEYGITKDDIEDRFKGRFTYESLAKRWEDIEKATNRETLLAKEGNNVVGIIVVTLHPDKNQLQAIYILPEYQGKGIGKKLWDEAQKYLDHTKNSIVHVATYNKNAIGFYERLGFKDTGKRWKDNEFKLKSGSIIPQMELELEAKDK